MIKALFKTLIKKPLKMYHEYLLIWIVLKLNIFLMKFQEFH